MGEGWKALLFYMLEWAPSAPPLALLGDAPGLVWQGSPRCLQLFLTLPICGSWWRFAVPTRAVQEAQSEEEWIHFCLTKHNISHPQQIRNTEFPVPVPSFPAASFTELCHSLRALDLPLPALHTVKAIPKSWQKGHWSSLMPLPNRPQFPLTVSLLNPFEKWLLENRFFFLLIPGKAKLEL